MLRPPSFVVFHDPTAERATDGSGAVNALTLAELGNSTPARASPTTATARVRSAA